MFQENNFRKKPNTTFPTQMVDIPFKQFDFSKFQILKFEEIIFLKDDFILFLVLVWAILVIVRRSTGPDFYNFFEVFESIQKVLGYDRGP